LIELLIVIAIILILIAIALPNFLDAQARAKVTKTEGDMRSMEQGLESYRLDWKKYFNSFQIKQLTTPVKYLTELPEDPFSPINTYDAGYDAVVNQYGFPVRRLYIYHGPDTYEGTAVDRIGLKWVITGLGPDHGWFDNELPSTTFFGYPRYNPTNGSRSRGNIERCGPGQIPQDKYRYFWD
jgi:general secretion pathway protein G